MHSDALVFWRIYKPRLMQLCGIHSLKAEKLMEQVS